MFLLHLQLYESKISATQQFRFLSIPQIKSYDKFDLTMAFYT